jgi:hypothetical protein
MFCRDILSPSSWSKRAEDVQLYIQGDMDGGQ